MFTSDLKGFPLGQAPLQRAEVAGQGWRVLQGDLPLPLAVLKGSALAHNLAWMQRFCDERGLSLAPHGKTTLSPELWQRQLDAGAWGISLATLVQVGLGVKHGVPRIVIPNQVVQWAELDALALLQRTAPHTMIWFLVDSLAQVDHIEAWAASRGFAGRLPVLLEVGIDGQRTGVRSAEQALALGQRVAASAVLALHGVECYEGGLASCDHERDTAGATALMDRVEAVARAGVQQGWFSGPEILITAGGSAIFDLVAERLTPDLGTAMPVRGVLRSGCYVTHDHQRYARYLCCVAQRLQLSETLRPALEVLSAVQSCPEPGLALLTMGRRDVSYDLDLPLPLWRSNGQGGTPQPVPAHWRIDALNDQHAYLRYDPAAPAHEHPALADMVGSGISHPCTTFDKWRWMPVVDDGYQVVDAVSIWL